MKLLIATVIGFFIGVMAVKVASIIRIRKSDWMPDVENAEMSEHCQDCIEEFGHPDNCIGFRIIGNNQTK